MPRRGLKAGLVLGLLLIVAVAGATTLTKSNAGAASTLSLQLAAILLMPSLVLAILLLRSRRGMKQQAQMERALRIKAEHLALAVRDTSHGIWNWSIHEDETYLSPGAIELLGLETHDVPGDFHELLSRVHRDDAQRAHAAMYRMLVTHQPLDIEFRVALHDQREHWVYMRGRPLAIADGIVVRAAGSVTDITDHKHMEAARAQLAEEEFVRSEQEQIAMLEKIQGRIGRELHDDLGQLLTGVAFLAKSLEQRLDTISPSEQSQMAWIVKLINESIDRVRFLSRQLSPLSIDQVTLGTALKRLVDDIQQIYGTTVTLQSTPDEALIPAEHVNQLFRIAQESISNALRHGHATRIGVRLDAWEHGARLAVSDNGHGFAASDISRNAGLGLRSMAIRAKSLHGRLRIRSGAGGTLVVARSSTETARHASAAPQEVIA